MSTIKLFLKTILYKPLFNALIFLVWLIPGHNVAWAIIILTIIIRLILLPSSLRAARAQMKLRDLQPELAKIQAEYKDDKTKQSQAVMEFYKKHQISPWGSCLPLLIQFPILIVLYYVFINGLGTQRFDLLYSFLPRPEVINTVWLGIDLARPDRWILPIMAGILQFIQGRQVQPKPQPGKGQDMQMAMSRQMLYLMPVFTVIIAMRLPAALPLYWIITTLFGIGQQWWAMRSLQTAKSEILNPKSETNGEKEEIRKNKEEIDKQVKHGVEVTVRRKK
jgi:YidC/Oxa1 family membrane protein insertase